MSKASLNISLQDLVASIVVKEIRGDFANPTIYGVSSDSRICGADKIFVALKGTQVDGHDFINAAIDKGTKVIVVERIPEKLTEAICYIRVKNTAKAYARLNGVFYSHPDRKMKVVGITGTNGKTSIATMFFQLFMDLGYRVGLLSTVETRINDQVIESTHTTPDARVIRKLFHQMLQDGCEFVFMEVSSHALVQDRVFDINFDLTIFSNLTRDHLDYHEDFASYRDAKKYLFDQLPKTAKALVNKDDRNADFMVQNCAAEISQFSINGMSEFKGRIIENSLDGMHLKFNNNEFFCRIIGAFNASNLLAVYAGALLLGLEEFTVLKALSSLQPVAGRMDLIVSQDKEVTAIVDYAHSPDALEKLLSTVKTSRTHGKILVVVGCGGDRDKGKRPQMAKVACNFADQLILTSDNPRSEDPNKIIEDMMMGVPEDCARSLLSIVDRKQAIKTACRLATKMDVIVVAGRGHEKYQEIMGVKYPLNDKELIKEEFMLSRSMK